MGDPLDVGWEQPILRSSAVALPAVALPAVALPAGGPGGGGPADKVVAVRRHRMKRRTYLPELSLPQF